MCPSSELPLAVVWWSVMIGLSVLNLGASIAVSLLLWRRGRMTPRQSSWSYESRPRPRVALRPHRPLQDLESSPLKRHTIVFPETAAYATIV